MAIHETDIIQNKDNTEASFYLSTIYFDKQKLGRNDNNERHFGCVFE